MHLFMRVSPRAMLALVGVFLTAALVQAGAMNIRTFDPTGVLSAEKVTIVAFDSAGTNKGTWTTTASAVTINVTSALADKSIKLTFQRASSGTVNLTLEGIYMDFMPPTPAKAMDVVVPK